MIWHERSGVGHLYTYCTCSGERQAAAHGKEVAGEGSAGDERSLQMTARNMRIRREPWSVMIPHTHATVDFS